MILKIDSASINIKVYKPSSALSRIEKSSSSTIKDNSNTW